MLSKRNFKLVLLMAVAMMLFFTSCSKEHPSEVITKEAAAQPADIEVFADGIDGADGIAMDNQGNMYVGSRSSNTIYKVDAKGKASEFMTLQCEELLCMTTDKDNNLYAAGKDKVFKIDTKGNISETGGFTCADDLRLDGKGNLFVTDSYENRVYKLTPDFSKSVFIESDIDRAKLGKGWHITGISFDKEYKNLYIARMKKGELLKYPINSAGTAGKPVMVVERMAEPDHMDMDHEGNLYVTLFRRGSLVKVDAQGKIETINEGTMRYATGIVLGRGDFGSDAAYIADYGKGIVYKVKLDSAK